MGYGEPEINVLLTYEGARVEWRSTYERDRPGFVEKIRAYAAVIDDHYAVQLDDRDQDLIRLDVRFRGDSTREGRLQLKGALFALVADTNWGGPG
jgi:hypothetical protein